MDLEVPAPVLRDVPWALILALVVAVGLLLAFPLRTRLPGALVGLLLAASGAGVGLAGMKLQPEPSGFQIALAVAALAVFVPFHVRVVLGPFGPRRRSGSGGSPR